jgi:hypothetical protein
MGTAHDVQHSRLERCARRLFPEVTAERRQPGNVLYLAGLTSRVLRFLDRVGCDSPGRSPRRRARRGRLGRLAAWPAVPAGLRGEAADGGPAARAGAGGLRVAVGPARTTALRGTASRAPRHGALPTARPALLAPLSRRAQAGGSRTQHGRRQPISPHGSPSPRPVPAGRALRCCGSGGSVVQLGA